MKNKKPTRCHLLFYCTAYRLNMFRTLLCPSSGARDYDVDYDQCGNQHHSRELLMIGIAMSETCWAYKKYNKITSGIYLVFLFFSYHNDARSNKHQIHVITSLHNNRPEPIVEILNAVFIVHYGCNLLLTRKFHIWCLDFLRVAQTCRNMWESWKTILSGVFITYTLSWFYEWILSNMHGRDNLKNVVK